MMIFFKWADDEDAAERSIVHNILHYFANFTVVSMTIHALLAKQPKQLGTGNRLLNSNTPMNTYVLN